MVRMVVSLRPLVEPNMLVKVRLGPLAKFGIDWRALLLAFEGRVANLDAQLHQRGEILDGWPQYDGAGIHFGAKFLVKLFRRLPRIRILGVAIDGFPFVPQIAIRGPRHDRRKVLRRPAGHAMQFQG